MPTNIKSNLSSVLRFMISMGLFGEGAMFCRGFDSQYEVHFAQLEQIQILLEGIIPGQGQL